jgi:hypothetical protein
MLAGNKVLSLLNHKPETLSPKPWAGNVLTRICRYVLSSFGGSHFEHAQNT